MELDAEKLRRQQAEDRVAELEGELKFFRDQASPEEAARLSMLNAKDQEIRSLRATNAETAQQLTDVRQQLAAKTRRITQLEKMLTDHGVELANVGKA